MKDKRKASRVKAELILNYDLFKAKRIKRKAVTEDISFNGVRVRIEKEYGKELTKGKMIGIEIQGFGGIPSFFIGGEVVRIEDSEDSNMVTVGIIFIEVNDYQKDKLAKFLHGV